jgi:hypothetical protein
MDANKSTIDEINEMQIAISCALITAIIFVSVVYPAYCVFLGR